MGILTWRPPDPSPRCSMYICVSALIPAPTLQSRQTSGGAVPSTKTPLLCCSGCLHGLVVGQSEAWIEDITKGQGEEPLTAHLTCTLSKPLVGQGSSRSFCPSPGLPMALLRAYS